MGSVASLWEGYPHASMSFLFKFFFIIQLSYWLHIFPELYFQKVKRDDWAPKIQYACLYLAFILAAYVTSFTRVALFLLLQAWLMYGWIMFQVKRAREAGPASAEKSSAEKSRARKTEQERAKARKARKEEEDALPEADQKIKAN